MSQIKEYNDYFDNEQDYNNWLEIIFPIITDEEFQKRKLFKHHEKQSVYEHSMLVSIISYKLAKKYKLDKTNLVIAGLLHDFYTCAWQYSSDLEQLDEKYREKFLPNVKRKPIFKKHGFIHPEIAAENAKEYYPTLVNEEILSAIRTHMFPLSICTKYKIPKYKTAWVLTWADKMATLKDFPKIKEMPKYLGIAKKK